MQKLSLYVYKPTVYRAAEIITGLKFYLDEAIFFFSLHWKYQKWFMKIYMVLIAFGIPITIFGLNLLVSVMYRVYKMTNITKFIAEIHLSIYLLLLFFVNFSQKNGMIFIQIQIHIQFNWYGVQLYLPLVYFARNSVKFYLFSQYWYD